MAGRLRIATRTLAALTVLLACLAIYPLGMMWRQRNPVPRLFFKGLLRAVGAKLTVTGEPAAAPSILLANHVSWIDIPALTAATGTVFVAHDGLAGHPAMRFLCDLNRTVFIARHDRASVAGQVDQVHDGLRRSGILTLFPEGTTDDGVSLLPFKSSLLASVESGEARTAIRPVWLDYGPEAREIAWFGDEPGLANVKRILARKGRTAVTVHVLAPLDDEQREDRKTIAAAARQAIARRLDQRVAL